MKNILTAIALCVVCAQTVKGQATANFITDPVGNVGPFVFDTDGTTKLDATFLGQIYAGTDANSLVAVGSPVAFTTIGSTPNPAAVGIIQAGTVNVTPSGNAFVGAYQIRAWDGVYNSFEAAQTAGGKHGSSDVVAGTQFGGNDPNGGAPFTAPNVNGFQSFSLVPEPGTVTLGLLGLGGLIASRRRKNA